MTADQDWIRLCTEKETAGVPIDPGRLQQPIQFSDTEATLRRRKTRGPLPTWESTRNSLPSVAEYWANLVANRRMWHEAGVDAEQLCGHCRETLRTLLGVEEAGLQFLDVADCAEVSMPFVDAEPHAPRAFPWEFVIANATRPKRGNLPATVIVRRLAVNGAPPAPAATPPRNYCFIECAPAPFDRLYGFDLEYVDIQKGLGLDDGQIVKIQNPRRSELVGFLAERQWDAVHITGLDVHQGAEILKAHRWEENSPLVRAYESAAGLQDGKVTRPPDGMVVLNDQRQLECMSAKALGDALSKTGLVTMNLYNSAANLAPRALAAGAQAALSFQDTFDDDLTDEFFTAFYAGWRLGNWQLLTAFAYALQELLPVARTDPARADLGVALWTRDSLLKGDS